MKNPFKKLPKNSEEFVDLGDHMDIYKHFNKMMDTHLTIIFLLVLYGALMTCLYIVKCGERDAWKNKATHELKQDQDQQAIHDMLQDSI